MSKAIRITSLADITSRNSSDTRCVSSRFPRFSGDRDKYFNFTRYQLFIPNTPSRQRSYPLNVNRYPQIAFYTRRSSGGSRSTNQKMSASAVSSGEPDLRYVATPASDAASQIAKPVAFPVQLYPALEPNKSGHLAVSDGHELYWEECGNPNGVPCVFLHGGPGGGCDEDSRRFFDPAYYRIIVFDQRGSGRSRPNASDDWAASLLGNTTPKLVEDIEILREMLNVEKWGLVLGGSWGSTLALAYAEAHPTRVRSMLLRGVFLFGPDEVDYLFSNGGTFGQNPQAWEAYCQFIEDTSSDWDRERSNLLGAYWERLTREGDDDMRNAAAAAFVGYELSISKSYVDPAIIKKYLGKPSVLIPFALMEVLYMTQGGFLRRGQILDECGVIAQNGIRVAITHGRADYVCQPQAAWRLTKALQAAGGDVELEFVSGAGHSDSEPGLVDAMVRATDRMRSYLG
ncbi:hypothetical protein CYMTET_10157 [Cymbomonas tetramitiformis]|uniref:Proline iminopeptidase n=1 Tax=Cymbomonas tetramitiformis TaxID=36881 RepID=A0AAE0GPN3_9CHLO|nr:hypothetical protein CYMTET_10157 [Cymbomonas tetramitiformis]